MTELTIPVERPRRSIPWLRYGRLAVTVTLLTLLVLTIIRQPEFLKTLATVRLPLVLLAFVFSMSHVLSKSHRWGIALRARGIKVTERYLIASYFVSVFFNNFLPSGVGGDAVRAVDSARSTGRGTEAITAIIIERGAGMVAVFGTGSLFALFQPNLPIAIALFAHAAFLGTLFGAFLLWQKFTLNLLNWIGTHLITRVLSGRLNGLWARIIGLYVDFQGYRTQWRLLGTLLIQSLIAQLFTIASLYTLILAFDQKPPIGAFVAVTSIATLFDLVPISINSLGVREGIYVFFLGLLGISSTVSIAFSLIIRLIALTAAMFGGAIFLWRNIHPMALPDPTVLPLVAHMDDPL